MFLTLLVVVSYVLVGLVAMGFGRVGFAGGKSLRRGPVAATDSAAPGSVLMIVAPRRVRCVLALMVGGFISLSVPTSSFAQNERMLGPWHPRVSMPDVGATLRGFTTSVTFADENATGYVPLVIEFDAQGKLAADRRLVYRFRTSELGQTPPRNGLTIDVPITVEQGTDVATFTRYLPKWSAGQAVEFSVLEDGVALKDYSGVVYEPADLSRRGLHLLMTSEREINWVVVTPEGASADEFPEELVDLFSIAHLQVEQWPLTNSFGNSIDQARSLWNRVGPVRKFLATGQDQLPDDWRGYQRYDVVVVSHESFQSLAEKKPVWNALRDWILCGGTVLVYDVPSLDATLERLEFRSTGGQEFTDWIGATASEFMAQVEAGEAAARNELAELERALVSDASRDETTQTAPAVEDPVSSTYLGVEIQNALLMDDREAIMELLRRTEQCLQRYIDIPRWTTKQWQSQVQMEAVGAGMLITMRRSDSYEVPSPVHWRIAAKAIGYRASPTVRRGVDPMLGHRRFAEWLIPGVAQPPVYTFIGLLTGFVILVGPVAYRKTAKAGRTYLMFAIAPTLALVTTVAMFSYGIVSDGFGTMVRIRQLTWVDGKSGDAGERIRSTYFAGLRPSRGLRFAGNAELTFYPETTGQSWHDASKMTPETLGQIRVEPDAQILGQGFLPSRQQRQFVVHQPRTTIGTLQLTTDRKAISPAEVTNHFGFELKEAVVRDSAGKYWSFGDLVSGESDACKPLSATDASKELGRLYRKYWPLTSEVREASRSTRRNSSQIYDVVIDTNRRLDRNLSVPDGTFEYWLEHHLRTVGEIPREHFVAIAEVTDDAVALEETELVASVRYVFGTIE